MTPVEVMTCKHDGETRPYNGWAQLKCTNCGRVFDQDAVAWRFEALRLRAALERIASISMSGMNGLAADITKSTGSPYGEIHLKGMSAGIQWCANIAREALADSADSSDGEH